MLCTNLEIFKYKKK